MNARQLHRQDVQMHSSRTINWREADEKGLLVERVLDARPKAHPSGGTFFVEHLVEYGTGHLGWRRSMPRANSGTVYSEKYDTLEEANKASELTRRLLGNPRGVDQSFVDRCECNPAFANWALGVLEAMERRDAFLGGIEEELRARGEATPRSRREFLECFYDVVTPERAHSLPADVFILQSDLRAALSPPDAEADAWASPAARYDVYLDQRGATLLAKAERAHEARSGAGSRLVAANLESSTLQRVSKEHLGSLRHYLDVDDRELLASILARVRAFMPSRNSSEAPFHGVLADNGQRKQFSPRRMPGHVITAASRARGGVNVESQETGWEIASDRPLTPEDRELIGIWARGAGGNRNTVRSMAYARLAEKLVAEFYSGTLGQKVEDVSIHQVTDASRDWMDFDIRADVPLDVKSCVHYRQGDRDPYVKAFKSSGGRDVAIAAVATELWHRTHEQVFLGLTTGDALRRVEHVINALPGRTQRMALNFSADRPPLWAFEMPGYEIDYEALYLIASVFALKPETTLAVAIACGRERETELYEQLGEADRCMVDLFASAIREAGYSKATIVAFAISEFIARCTKKQGAAAFISFFQKLISIESFSVPQPQIIQFGMEHFGSAAIRLGNLPQPGYEVAIDIEESACGGLFDPTGSVARLLKLLRKVGERLEAQALTFSHFSVVKPEMLIGKTSDGREITVYAYCGGLVSDNKPCNAFPLVLGDNKNCEECGKLVCKRCGFCCASCDVSRADPFRGSARESARFTRVCR